MVRPSTSAGRSAAPSCRSLEDDLTYLVDLGTYLDTGFFIDQRLTRRLVRELCRRTAVPQSLLLHRRQTVNALAGGSPASTTVDLSATYLDWAARNLAANGIEARRQRGRRRTAA